MSAPGLKGMEAGSTAWASGEPPRSRDHWERSIIELAEQGDMRFVGILRKHVQRGVINAERAHKALGLHDDEATTA